MWHMQSKPCKFKKLTSTFLAGSNITYLLLKMPLARMSVVTSEMNLRYFCSSSLKNKNTKDKRKTINK